MEASGLTPGGAASAFADTRVVLSDYVDAVVGVEARDFLSVDRQADMEIAEIDRAGQERRHLLQRDTRLPSS